MHTCKSGVARESLSGTAQHEHAGAPLPVRARHSSDPSPEPVPLRHGQPGHDEDGQMVLLLDRDRYLDFMHWQLRHIADVVKRTGGPEPDAAPVSGGNREVHSCA